MKNLTAIVLAAGKGTRMKSKKAKVLHEVAGRPMLFYPLQCLKEGGAGKTVVVIGHEAENVKAAFRDEKAAFVVQKEQLGTGHAVMCALKALKGFSKKGAVLILSGDVPLITAATVKALYGLHRKNRAALSLITAVLPDPAGYGRVVRGAQNEVVRVVEDKDASSSQKEIREINTGIYVISREFLLKNVKKIGAGNAQREYYLPDLIHLASGAGEKVSALTHLYPEEVMGINNRIELSRACAVMRRRINESLMLSGVTMTDPATVYIDHGVSVGADSVICPSVRLTGSTVIGSGCVIEEGVVIKDSVVGDDSRIRSYSVVDSSETGCSVSIGPFARVRPGCVIGGGASVGNFVEVKKSSMGKGTKANHLAYIGDSVIGRGVNIGAGVITCNYDGVKKHVTNIEDGAFIGSDSQLVAPVTVGRGAYVGSGTTVTKDVPPGSLVITRAQERVIKGWAEKRMKKAKKK